MSMIGEGFLFRISCISPTRLAEGIQMSQRHTVSINIYWAYRWGSEPAVLYFLDMSVEEDIVTINIGDDIHTLIYWFNDAP